MYESIKLEWYIVKNIVNKIVLNKDITKYTCTRYKNIIIALVSSKKADTRDSS